MRNRRFLRALSISFKYQSITDSLSKTNIRFLDFFKLIGIPFFLSKHRRTGVKSFSRFLRSQLIPVLRQDSERRDPDAIDLLLLTTEKDFASLPFAIKSCEITSLNPISKCFVVTPKSAYGSAKQVLNSHSYSFPVKVQVEDDFIDSQLITVMKETLKERMGHALQQLVKFGFVALSDSNGVLVVDSDTLILKNQLWLDTNGRQIIQLSWEEVPEHYQHLDELCGRRLDRRFNTITHHMLMQPKLLREFSHISNRYDLYSFQSRALELANHKLSSIFSLDYLYYGLNLIDRYPEKVIFSRWCNKAILPYENPAEYSNVLQMRDQIPYKSLSYHSWQTN